jgi:hypothetical protein
MPSGRVHGRDAKVFGYNNKVNKFIDLPYKWMKNKHRVFFHTPVEAMMIGWMIDGTKGAMGGLRHIMLDEIKDKKMKRTLELIARRTPKKPKGPYVNVELDLASLRSKRARIKLFQY